MESSGPPPDDGDDVASDASGDAAGDGSGSGTGSASAADGFDDPAEARLADALERVAHGATVSVPSILVQRVLTLAFTAVLTNGFAPGAYGLFALARRLQRFLRRLALGFRAGLSRYLPNAASEAERDQIATFATLLLLGVATAFGALLFLAAPAVATIADEGPPFATFLRVFALGLPAAVSLYAVSEILRGLEDVGPLNLVLRIGFPAAQLAVGVVGTLVFADLALIAGAAMAAMGLVAVAGAAWLVRARGLRPRLPAGDWAVPRRYLSYTFPLFLGGFATTIQRLGFYPLIALYLSGIAGGVFAVGTLLGMLVRLPLLGINQLIPPVAAALHSEGHRDALRRLYHVTSRLVLVGVTGLAVPVVVYRETVMGLFGPTYVDYAPLLAGFVGAQVLACAAGSVGFLLMMTDNQRALLVVNTVVTFLLAAVAVPLTARYGLPGLVGSYVLMLGLNNGAEVVVLYRLEGLQPFTRLHARPLLAAVPLALLALAAKHAIGGGPGALVGTALGLTAYALALRLLGFTPVERRLGATLRDRYRAALPSP